MRNSDVQIGIFAALADEPAPPIRKIDEYKD